MKGFAFVTMAATFCTYCPPIRQASTQRSPSSEMEEMGLQLILSLCSYVNKLDCSHYTCALQVNQEA